MMEHLDQEELEAFKEAFDSFDWNNNGKVSSTYLQEVINLFYYWS